MTTVELQHVLQSLRNLTAENEIVEFKEAKTGYDFNKLGKYFSALSNEANLKMVDTAGGGIKKIFNFQRVRFFPMPDYDLSGGRVKVSISGKILDMDYARLLARNKDLTLEEIMMLDKVQKKQQLADFEEKHLKNKKLIEGRKPNYFIGLSLSQKTGQKAAYSKNKAFDKSYFWI